jgi:extradiol dioxygenase family protein
MQTQILNQSSDRKIGRNMNVCLFDQAFLRYPYEGPVLLLDEWFYLALRLSGQKKACQVEMKTYQKILKEAEQQSVLFWVENSQIQY